MRTLLAAAAAAGALALVPGAAAVPPGLLTAGQEARHPTATFSLPSAEGGAVYVASAPDRATDGSFFEENVVLMDTLTDAEVSSGRWLSESQLDPGTYHLLVEAWALDSCFDENGSGPDPSCAEGFSNVLALQVPKPVPRFSASATLRRPTGRVELRLTARPWGERMPYRVCYRLATRAQRCVAGRLAGFSWSEPAPGRLSVPARGLPRVATFTWHALGRAVATRRVVVR